MAKASAGGSKEYGSSGSGDAYDPQAAEDSPKAPETELQDKEIELAQMRAREKRLQDEILRLTQHAANSKALDAQLSAAAIEAATHAREELSTFVTSGMKALDAEMVKRIEEARNVSAETIKNSRVTYKQTVDYRIDKQAEVAKQQEALSEAMKRYAAAKEVTARVNKATADLLALRQKVEAKVKANEFAAAGFWLFELQQQLDDPKAPTFDKAAANLSKAWKELQDASKLAGDAADELTKANAKELTAKKALDDAEKNRIEKILETLGVTSVPKTAAA